MVTQAFKEFVDSKVEHKFLILNNFYRDRLYLRTLAEYFYGDKTFEVGTCIFTKDGDFLRSTPTDTDVFWTRHNTVLFEPKQTVIFFDSEEAVDLYKKSYDSSDSSHYSLSKTEIIEIIEDDLNSQIEGVKKVIEDYRKQLSLHQNRVDYLGRMKIDLKNASHLEDQVSRIEDLLDAANMKLVDTKFKFVVNEVLDKDLVLDHDGGDVYDIHFVYDGQKTIISNMLDDRVHIESWLRDALDRLDFYQMIVDQFESKLVESNRSSLHVSLQVNQDLIARVFYIKNLDIVEIFVDQYVDSHILTLNEYSKVKIYDAEDVRFNYQRQAEISQIDEVFRDIEETYRQCVVDQKGMPMKSFKLDELDEVIKYIRHLDVEEQFDKVEIDPEACNLIVTSNLIEKPAILMTRWHCEDDVTITDNVEKYLRQKSKFLHAFRYLKDLIEKSGKLEYDYAEKEDQSRVLIEDIENGKDYAFILELDENRETLVSVCLKVEIYNETGFFETRIFQSEEKMHLGKVKDMLDKFEAELEQKGNH